MGVREMAFGLGVINMKSSKSIELQYGNLWLPSRLNSKIKFPNQLKSQTNKFHFKVCFVIYLHGYFFMCDCSFVHGTMPNSSQRKKKF
jgi:hypothetical protein